MQDGYNPYREFNQLIERHGKLIMSICRVRSFGRAKVCRELMQECYVALIDHIEDLRRLPAERERGWVKSQCRGAISHYWRSLRRGQGEPIDEELAETLAAPREVTAGTFDELMVLLTAKEREFFTLVVEGASDEELSERLGVERKTVVQMRYRIKKKIKEYIEQ